MEDFRDEVPLAVEDGVSASEADEAMAEAPPAKRPDLRLLDRLQRINAYRTDTHDSPDARTIVLRGVCSDLLEVEAGIAEAFRRAMVETPITVENLDEYSESIDFEIRLAKQITQTTQLEMRLTQREG